MPSIVESIRNYNTLKAELQTLENMVKGTEERNRKLHEQNLRLESEIRKIKDSAPPEPRRTYTVHARDVENDEVWEYNDVTGIGLREFRSGPLSQNHPNEHVGGYFYTSRTETSYLNLVLDRPKGTVSIPFPERLTVSITENE